MAARFVRSLSLDPKTIRIPKRFPPADQDYVQELAEDILEHGQAQPVGVQAVEGEYEVIFGKHRTLAMRVLKTTCRAELWETDDPAEAEALSIAEQLRRREVSEEERRDGVARLVEIAEGISGNDSPKINPAEPQQKKKRGRPKSAKAEAKRAVAKQLGVSESAVKKATTKEAPEPTVTKDELGNVLPADVAASYLAAQALCDDVENALNASKSAYTRHSKQITADMNGDAASILGNLGGLGAKLEREVTQAAHVARSHRPYAVCPSCKLHPGGKLPSGKKWPGRAECGMCRGTGWVGLGVIKRTENILLAYGDGAVTFIDGDAVVLSEIR